MNGNFKHGSYLQDKLTKNLFKLLGYDMESLEKGQTNAILLDTKGCQWICYYEELPLRFKLLPNQDAARILYDNNVRGIR